MISSGFLVPPEDSTSEQPLWDETWKRIDRFLPGLRKDLSCESLGKSSEKESFRVKKESNEAPSEHNDVLAIVEINNEEGGNKT